MIALVAIAKNEDRYIEEWLDYNRKLGFDHIYLYMNNWTTNVEREWLTKIQKDGGMMQMPAYNGWLNKYRNQYDYVAFFDCDEYLCLKKHNSINEFLQEYGNPNGIAINWMMFGSGERMSPEGNSLIKQYTLRGKNPNHHIKTILNCRSNGMMQMPHNPNIYLKDTNGKLILGPFNYNAPTDVVQLNHYYAKSYQEWEERCRRGRADWYIPARIDEWFQINKQNCDVLDTLARDFMYN